MLVHGWPLSGALLGEAGHRPAGRGLPESSRADRRGFGQSSKPATGYDYDTFAADLDKLMTKLDLHEATLVGFDGRGEVARFLSKYGSKRVAKAVFMAAIPPFLLKRADNPSGLEGSVFKGIQQAIAADRPAFLSTFFRAFLQRRRPGRKAHQRSSRPIQLERCSRRSAKGTLDCVSAWLTDFRQDLRASTCRRWSFTAMPTEFFHRCYGKPLRNAIGRPDSSSWRVGRTASPGRTRSR